MKEIVIAMVDDWELRGTGVGNVIENQVNPCESLCLCMRNIILGELSMLK